MIKRRLAGVLLLAVILSGCAVTATSALNSILKWAPVAAQGFVDFVTIADPTSNLATIGNTVVAEFAELKIAVASATAAGAGLPQQQKVIAELQVIIAEIPRFESAAAASGTLSTTDQEYIAAGALLFETAAQIYEAELTGTTAQLENINGPCFGLNVHSDGSAQAWADCTGDPSEALYASLDPVPNTNTTSPTSSKKTVKLTVKHGKVGNFKRQLSALARQYGHPEKQQKLTLAEHLHIK